MSHNKQNGRYETTRLISLPVSEIRSNPAQPRQQFDQNALEELAASISRYGVLQPLTVRRTGRQYELISGERRLRAAKLAGLQRVPCLIMHVDTIDAAALALVENLHRADLDFLEEAQGLQKLITSCGISQEEAASRVGKSQSAVANKLRILKLPMEMLTALRDAGMTERHARALLRLEDEQRRLLALEQIITRKLNVARTEELVEELLHIQESDRTKSARSIYILKDVRLFLNTVSKGMHMMKESGIPAECGKDETETDIILTIRIPKTVERTH